MGDIENFKEQLLEGNFEGVQKAFCSEFTNIIIDEEIQNTPIHIVCQHGHFNIAKLLIENQCNIESETKLNWRPIHIACWYGHIDLVKLLIEHGCQLECQTNKKMTPILVACDNGHLDIVELLIEYRCNIECEADSNERPIHIACWQSHLDIVKCLIKHRCNIECETTKGMRPVHYGCMRGNFDIVKLLVENNCDIYCQTVYGCSPVDLSTQFNHGTCAGFLTDIINKRTKIFSNIRDDNVEEFEQLYNESILAIVEHESGLSVIELALDCNADRIIQSIKDRKLSNPELAFLVNAFRNIQNCQRMHLVQECILCRSIRDHHQAGFQWAYSAGLINGHRNFVASSYLEWATEYGAYAFVNEILKKSIYEREAWNNARNIARDKGYDAIFETITCREYLMESRRKANFSALQTSICDGDVDMMKFILASDFTDFHSNEQVLRAALELARMLGHDECVNVLQGLNIDSDISEILVQSPVSEPCVEQDAREHEQDELMTRETLPQEAPPTCWSCLCKCCIPDPRPSGLTSSSTSYRLNCMIQALASSEVLIEQLENANIPPKSQSLSGLVDLLHSLNESENVPENTKKLENLAQLVQVPLSLQQDAFELFSALIKGIQDEMKNNQPEQIPLPMKVTLVHRFQGINILDRLQDHLGLSLVLCGNFANKTGVTLEFLINEHFTPKIIDDDPSKSTQRFFYKDSPEILILHIQTNKGDSVKPKYYINYNELMTLQLDVVLELNSQRMRRISSDYKIRSIVQHKTDAPNTHRVTYRSWRGNWYLINNRQVKRVKFNKKICPYVLLYEKQTSSAMEQKPSGLTNTSNTCYVNSIVQVVASSDLLIQQYDQLKILNSQSSSLNIFLDLLHGVNETENVAANSKMVESLVQSIHWDTPSQQDAFEMFSALIKAIHEEFISIHSDQIEMPLKAKLIHRYKDKNIPDQVQDHLALNLGLCGNYSNKPGVTLEFLIREHFMPTTIDDDPSKLTQVFFYKNAPDILILHIQAYKWDGAKGEMIKPEYHIIYYQEMTLELDIVIDASVKETRSDKVVYHIRGVVQHLGDVSGGHYVAYRHWMGGWYLVNDDHVDKSEFTNEICPYILVYERRDSR